MSNNTKTYQKMKRMLLEVELKSIFANINTGNNIYVTLNDGAKRGYKVISNMSGKIIMQDLSDESNNEDYIINPDSLKDNTLTIYKYDNNAASNDFKGEEIKMDVTEISMLNTKSGYKSDIDVKNGDADFNSRKEEDLSRIDSYNDLMETLEIGDTLIITTESEGNVKGDDTIINDLYFELINIKKSWYVFNLKGLEGDSDGVKSKVNLKIMSVVGNKKFYIGKDGFFVVRNNNIEISIKYGKSKGLIITGVKDVALDDVESEVDDYSKEDLEKELKADGLFNDLINKKPGFLKTLFGASPKGLMQLKKMVHQHKVNNSYLTKGKKVKIVLLSSSIKVDLQNKLLNKKGQFYKVDVIGDKTLKYGVVGRGHFEFELIDEIEDSTYKTKIIFYNTNKRHRVVSKNATIKIIE